jgi:mannose-6-phosphate isomerase-like protein (cupin superfamily)
MAATVEMQTDYIKRVDKVWGRERWIVNNELYCGKILDLNCGHTCSLHSHPVKDETFFVMGGYCFLEIGKQTLHLHKHFSVRIPPNTPHRFWTDNPTGCTIIEFSTHHDDADVVRYTESK